MDMWTNPIPSANFDLGLPLDVAGGKKDDTSCVVAEVVEWTKEAGEVTCFAELQSFAHGQHPFMTWMMIQYAMTKSFCLFCGTVLWLWLWFVVGRCHKGINGIRKGKRPFAEIHSNLRTDITGCSHFPVVAVSEE